MSSNTELQQLCQRLVDSQFETIHDAEQALEKFELLTTPKAVLGLIEGIEHKEAGHADEE